MKLSYPLAVIAAILIAGPCAAAEDDASAPSALTSVTTMKSTGIPIATPKKELPIVKRQREDTPQFRGEGLYVQRCGMCHLPEWRKTGPRSVSYAPPLVGVLKNADADREAAARAHIKNGSLLMPGFSHTFTQTDFEDLLAYLKTL